MGDDRVLGLPVLVLCDLDLFARRADRLSTGPNGQPKPKEVEVPVADRYDDDSIDLFQDAFDHGLPTGTVADSMD